MLTMNLALVNTGQRDGEAVLMMLDNSQTKTASVGAWIYLPELHLHQNLHFHTPPHQYFHH
jgi:hypothetical protein